MNQQQQDEIIALQSIFPDSVSFSSNKDGTTTVEILISPDWGQERKVLVWDRERVISTPSSSPKLKVEGDTQGGRGQGRTRGRRRGGRGGTSVKESRNRVEEVTLTPSPSTATRGRGRQSATAQSRMSNSNQTPSRTTSNGVHIVPQPLPHLPRASVVLRLGNVPGEEPQFIPSRLPSAAQESHPLPPLDTLSLSPPQPTTLNIRYLPPFILSISLPPTYPSEESPIPTLKDATKLGWGPFWMSQEWKKRLESKLRELWTGEECLWSMVDMLAGDEDGLAKVLDLEFPLVLREDDIPCPTSMSATSPRQPLSRKLAENDRLTRSTTFKSENFTCEICLEAKKGHKCVRLEKCGDVFCLPCLVSYFTMLITEGLVRSVHCPSISCVRARAAYSKSTLASPPPPTAPSTNTSPDFATTPTERKIDPLDEDPERPGEVDRNELMEIVGDELTKRWEWLKEKERVESDPSVSFCPRQSCQTAVPTSSTLESDDSTSNSISLRTCPRCSYSFCVFCRKGYHGVSACAISNSASIVEAYLGGDEEGKILLEKRYGKGNVKRLVQVFEEERVNREWLEGNSKACPRCEIPIEKSAGCNHMQCGKCATHFCYRCGEQLKADNPYPHFSTPGKNCYNKLFDFVPGNEPPPEEWLGDIL